MRITFIAPFGLGQKTTVWARTLPLARALADQGHNVSILIPPWDTPTDAGTQWTDGGVELINVKLTGGTPVIVARLIRQIDAFQPDIVHIVKPRAHAGLVQWWLWQRRRMGIRDQRLEIREQRAETGDQRLLESPVSNLQSPVSHPRLFLDIDDWERAWAAINPYPRLVARFLAWQEEWGIRHADGITAASRWLVERAQQYTPQTPVLYLPNGVEISAECRVQSAEAGAATVLFFTRFVEVEPDWLAAFWQALHGQLPAARLLVAGQAFQPGREALYQQQMRVTNPTSFTQVEWLGYVKPAEVYARASCAIFPARAVPLQQAKCSVRLATTLLHGVPVVASAVGEQAAYGANGAAALLPPTATPTEFAQAVRELLQDPTQRVAMIAQARQHLVDHYQWKALGQTLTAFYQGAS
ncbi:MAG: glycosyltransferase family 4 protein [Caldilineaceae bacterium]